MEGEGEVVGTSPFSVGWENSVGGEVTATI